MKYVKRYYLIFFLLGLLMGIQISTIIFIQLTKH